MTDPLIIDSVTYISIREVAAASHLSTEYLARLARQHRLRARMIGRTWFIETHSLQQFLSIRPTQKA
jgi:excisionase family DNA binding protein